MAVGTRESMVVSAALLIREQGARATSIDDVLAHSGAPRGSVYHHFPGGRAELLAEATDYAGDFIAGRIGGSGGTLELLDELIDLYSSQLEATDFRAGCPVVAVAVEADAELQDNAARAFTRWGEVLSGRLVDDGLEAESADELSVLVISAIEGALVIARARRSSEPLEQVHRRLRSLLSAEIDQGGT